MQRKTFKCIQGIIRKPPGRFKLTKTLQSIHDEFSIGVLVGVSSIAFSHNDMEKLRALVESSIVLDPLLDDIDLPRGILAEKASNEKLTKIAVFEDFIQIAKNPETVIKTKNGEAKTPHDTLLSIPPNHIDFAEEAIVIIENGDTIRNWSQIILPSNLERAILIYRGHGQSAKYVRDIILNHPKSKVYGYFDFDPSGISKALTLGLENIIIPENWENLQNSHIFKFNKLSVFWQQQTDLNFLFRHESLIIRKVAQHVKTYSIAITQEHLTAHNIQLIAIKAQ